MKKCEMCWRPACHRHHVLGGPNRKWSEKYGLVANLCYECHAEVHANYELGLVLKRKYQALFLETHSMDEWMQIFGRNYII